MSLKNHPFPVEAFFKSSTVLTFALPKEKLIHKIPECLELDTLNDKWAFLAVAMVQTKHLRPKGFPKFIGSDFFLIGYRVFVRYKTSSGKRLRGLYILKSQTDSKLMELMGNTFTHYNYSTTDIKQINNEKNQTIKSNKSNFKIVIDKNRSNINLPIGSPFSDWKQARRFAGPLPFTFASQEQKKEVLIIEGVRKNWNPKPINIIQYSFDFMRDFKLNNLKLANAFIIENIPYQWKKGKIDTWK